MEARKSFKASQRVILIMVDSKESFLIELMRSGQVRIGDGTLTFLNEFMILFPVKTFLKMHKEFVDRMGRKEANTIMKELGRYQVTHAIKRYSKVISIEDLQKDKILDFGIRVVEL